MAIVVGTAAWTIPASVRAHFVDDGSHLERYARLLSGVEINSSFYRPHRTSTYARWAASVPAAFRFAVKVPRSITHEARLVRCGALWKTFLSEISHLGAALGPLLVQLPPSFAFDRKTARAFFTMVRRSHEGSIACEPRHPTWFSPEADTLLTEHDIARVDADPRRGPPQPTSSLAYMRLHGAPRMYYSAYEAATLDRVAGELRKSRARDTWCMFDNTALGYATVNALELVRRLSG